MMNSKRTVISTLVGAAFALSVWASPIDAFACDKEKESHKHSADKQSGMMTQKDDHSYAHMVAMHAEALQLTDEQLGKIVRLHMKDKEKHKRIKERMHKNHHAFHDASMQPGTDEAALRRLGEKHIADHRAMVEHHLSDREAVHAILTSEQISKLKTLKIQHEHGGDHSKGGHDHGKEGGKMQHRKHGGGHGGGGHNHSGAEHDQGKAGHDHGSGSREMQHGKQGGGQGGSGHGQGQGQGHGGGRQDHDSGHGGHKPN